MEPAPLSLPQWSMRQFAAFLRDCRGATSIEYAVIAGITSVVCLTIYTQFKPELENALLAIGEMIIPAE